MLECSPHGRSVVRASGSGGICNRLFILLPILLLCVRSSLAGGVSLGAHLVCARAAGLTDKQRAMCRSSPAAIAAVGDGLRMAYAECREQLSGYRWNCSGVGDGNDFGHVMPLATREAAFTYAITSAGVTHALSSACARGDLPACHCNTNRRRMTGASEQFQWGGCGEAAYGMRFARRFLDARELEADARSLMNLHNNRVGRKAKAERRYRKAAAQIGAGVPGTIALVLRAGCCVRLFRDARTPLQQNVKRRKQLRNTLLRPRLQHGPQSGGDKMSVPVPLVLPCHLRQVYNAHRNACVQLRIKLAYLLLNSGRETHIRITRLCNSDTGNHLW